MFVCLLEGTALGGGGGVGGGMEDALRWYMKRNTKCPLGFVLPPHQEKYMPGSGSPDFVSKYFQQAESSLEGCQVGRRDCHTETSI